MRLQWQHRVPPQFLFLLNHFVHSYALTIACPSATQVQSKVQISVHSQGHPFVHLYIDLKGQLLMQFELYYSVHTKLYHQSHLKCIFVVSFALSYASAGALKSSLLFSFFNSPGFASICQSSPFLRAFSCAFYITSHLQSQLHLWELFVSFLCSSKRIIDRNLKCTMIYINVCIIYSPGIALYASIK